VPSEIKIGVSELIGKEKIADWCKDISDTGIDLEVIEYKNQPVMALEWLLPTGIVFTTPKV